MTTVLAILGLVEVAEDSRLSIMASSLSGTSQPLGSVEPRARELAHLICSVTGLGEQYTSTWIGNRRPTVSLAGPRFASLFN